VRFSGYGSPSNYVLTNSSVETSSNLISFDLTARDYDENNRSSYTRIENSPDDNLIDCEIFLVNPDWTAHENTWNYSVEQIAYHRCVNHALTTVYHSGRGEFQYSIAVNVEGTVSIAGENLDVNGTTLFGFYCSYDADGVLLQYSTGDSSHYYDDFNQVTYTSQVTITRAVPALFAVSTYPFVIYQALLAVITLLVGIGCGFWIGKRQRRIQT
jgi:hypothetical protein